MEVRGSIKIRVRIISGVTLCSCRLRLRPDDVESDTVVEDVDSWILDAGVYAMLSMTKDARYDSMFFVLKSP